MKKLSKILAILMAVALIVTVSAVSVFARAETESIVEIDGASRSSFGGVKEAIVASAGAHDTIRVTLGSSESYGAADGLQGLLIDTTTKNLIIDLNGWTLTLTGGFASGTSRSGSYATFDLQGATSLTIIDSYGGGKLVCNDVLATAYSANAIINLTNIDIEYTGTSHGLVDGAQATVNVTDCTITANALGTSTGVFEISGGQELTITNSTVTSTGPIMYTGAIYGSAINPLARVIKVKNSTLTSTGAGHTFDLQNVYSSSLDIENSTITMGTYRAFRLTSASTNAEVYPTLTLTDCVVTHTSGQPFLVGNSGTQTQMVVTLNRGIYNVGANFNYNGYVTTVNVGAGAMFNLSSTNASKIGLDLTSSQDIAASGSAAAFVYSTANYEGLGAPVAEVNGVFYDTADAALAAASAGDTIYLYVASSFTNIDKDVIIKPMGVSFAANSTTRFYDLINVAGAGNINAYSYRPYKAGDEVSVTFIDPNGDTIKTVVGYPGTSIAAPATEVIYVDGAAYEFKGWKTSSTATETVEVNAFPSDDAVYYASAGTDILAAAKIKPDGTVGEFVTLNAIESGSTNIPYVFRTMYEAAYAGGVLRLYTDNMIVNANLNKADNIVYNLDLNGHTAIMGTSLQSWGLYMAKAGCTLNVYSSRLGGQLNSNTANGNVIDAENCEMNFGTATVNGVTYPGSNLTVYNNGQYVLATVRANNSVINFNDCIVKSPNIKSYGLFCPGEGAKDAEINCNNVTFNFTGYVWLVGTRLATSDTNGANVKQFTFDNCTFNNTSTSAMGIAANFDNDTFIDITNSKFIGPVNLLPISTLDNTGYTEEGKITIGNGNLFTDLTNDGTSSSEVVLADGVGFEKANVITDNATYTLGTTDAPVTVTWNVNGEETTEKYVPGSTPVYSGTTGVVTENYKLSCTWDKVIAPITADTTYVGTLTLEVLNLQYNLTLYTNLDLNIYIPAIEGLVVTSADGVVGEGNNAVIGGAEYIALVCERISTEIDSSVSFTLTLEIDGVEYTQNVVTSVTEYLDQLISSEGNAEYEAAKPLAHAIVVYAYEALAKFGEAAPSDKLEALFEDSQWQVNDGLYYLSDAAEQIAGAALPDENLVSGVIASVELGSAPTWYFTDSEGNPLNGVTVTYTTVDNNEVTANIVNGYIDADIKLCDFGSVLTFSNGVYNLATYLNTADLADYDEVAGALYFLTEIAKEYKAAANL